MTHPFRMTAKAGFRAVDVAGDLGGKFLRRWERVVAPEALDEFNRDRLAIEVIPVVEQIDLDQSLPGSERRPAADVCDRIVMVPSYEARAA